MMSGFYGPALSHKKPAMTKYGLRARVLAFTLLPTLLIGGLLAGYFSFHRYQQVENQLIEQGINIIEPLAIASEYGMQQSSREGLKRLIGLSHRKNSPLITSIAVFNPQNELFVTSNYHRAFVRMRLPTGSPIPELTSVERHADYIIIRTPIIAEASLEPALDNESGPPKPLGYIALQLNTDRALVVRYRDGAVALLAWLLGVGLSVYFGINLVNVVINPINRMVRAVYQIREGRLDTRVRGQMNGELDMLKNGINAMAKAMAEYHNEMQMNIDQATSDLRETLEQIEIQNVELDMAKKRAQEAARVKSEFLANMSHELRTPLNGVIGFAKQLMKTPLTPNQNDYLGTIEKSAKSLLNIINDILDFSKLEAGKLQLEEIPFSLRDHLNETMTLLAPSAHDKGLTLSVRVDRQVPDLLLGDPLRLQQILTNITGNAIKFTEQGNVDVHFGRLGSPDEHKLRLCTRIRDTGIGMTPQQQSQLFQPFNQGDSSISRRYGGTGLGLVITQKLIQQMGGQIEVRSQAGQGSEFIYTLDLKVASQPALENKALANLADQAVILVEPDDWSRQATGELLAEWQMRVQAVRQWEEAKLAEGDDPWLLLGLGSQPDLAQTQRLLEALPISPQKRILLVNSHDPGLLAQLLALGAAHCLSKPVPHTKLITALCPGDDPQAPLAAPPQRSRWPLSVLAVDDNPANLKLIGALLGERVEEVHSCQNGRQAVEQAQRVEFDLIFMDIQMPIMDGIAATQAIRQEGCNQHTPIIAVTAHAIPGERERLIAQGMDDYLAKPIDESQLETLLQRYLPSPTSSQPPLLDWTLALRQSAGKPDLAHEMLELLWQTYQELQSVWPAAEPEACLAAVHKLHGGCAYCGVPRLQQHCQMMESALRAGNAPAQLEPEWLELTDLMTQLQQESQQLDH